MLSSTPFGTFTCYSPEQWPLTQFSLTTVRVRNGRVTGQYNSGYGLIKARGQTTKAGFQVTIDYLQSGWRFKYKVVVTKIGKTRATVNFIGNTYYAGTERSCKYVFKGVVARSQ